MSIPRSLRPLGLFKPSEACTSCLRAQRRNIFRTQQRGVHFVPNLTHHDSFTEEGVPGLITAEGYDISWTQYQKLMVDRLNIITKGFEESDMRVKDIALKHARNPGTASLFNHASMAHNNHFFFTTLGMKQSDITQYTELHNSLVAAFGSIETLRKEMLETAAKMFGPGFVWLVWSRAHARLDTRTTGDMHNAEGWRILTTYNAGSPYPEAGFRRQDKDMANQRTVPQNDVAAFGGHSNVGKTAVARGPGTGWVDPVLCVNTWEHVYLRDWTVLGKRDYLYRWWETIDWQVVNNNAPAVALRTPSYAGGLTD